MRVTIDHKDIDAIHFAMGQVESALESSEDEAYNAEANQALKRLYRLIDRFWLERAKADELNEARALVKRLNSHWLHPKVVDKQARAILKQIRAQDGKLGTDSTYFAG